MIKVKTIEDILFWAELRHQNKIDAIKSGIFGKTDEEINKNLAIYKKLEEKVIDQEIKEIDNIVKQRKHTP